MINYIFFAISGLLAVGLTIALAKRINTIRREKNNALAQLQQANDDLENRVNARTAELTATNNALKQRLDELSTLNLIVQTAATVTNLDSALEIIAGTLTRLLNASHCMVALLNDERTQLTVTIDVSRGTHSSNRVGQCIPVANYPSVQQVLKNGRSVVVAPAAQPVQAETAAPDRFRLLVPLLSRGKVIGVIDVAATEPGHQFST
ncbi:MAG: GAF domain-containing protein, partial [Chloroflexi bacterium]